MGAKTGIEWTGSTWNPVVGCEKVSQGCKHCYAKMLHDMRHKAYLEGKKVPMQYAQSFEVVQLKPERLDMPLHWKKPRMIFVDSVSDLFHEDVPDEFIGQVFGVMSKTPWHTYQVLTKRAERMLDVVKRVHAIAGILPNVWLGVSVEDQKSANFRIPFLLKAPAAVRFLSCEPLLAQVNLTELLYEANGDTVFDNDVQIPWRYIDALRGYYDNDHQTSIDWVIAGGESGPEARPMHPEWARSIRDQCQTAGVPFFFKQWGEWMPNNQVFDWTTITGRKYHSWGEAGGSLWVGKQAAGHLLDGEEWRQMPNV